MAISVRRASDPIRPTSATASTPVAPSTAVTEPLPNHPEPEPNERLCCQCQHFSQSPYGSPLGLCMEHGSRIQHSTSEPARFGCGNFDLKEGAK